MQKPMAIYDGLDTVNDKLGYTTFKTSIDVRNAETGEIIFKGLKNKVILPGSGLIARKLFDISKEEVTPSYNTAIGDTLYTPATDDAPTTIDAETDATVDNHKILLFCCGIDGCGSTNSEVFPVDYTKWISPENLVPFKYVPANSDLTDDLRLSYFGRTEVENGNYIAYYFKRFEEQPVLIQQFADGSGDIKSDIYTQTGVKDALSFVEMSLKITKTDIRSFFERTSGIPNARINSISLCSAYPVEENGYLYFKDIRPVTKLNFPNEQFIDLSKGIDITYHIYM